MYESYRAYYVNNKKLPHRAGDAEVLLALSDKIEAADIWIPDGGSDKKLLQPKKQAVQAAEKGICNGFFGIGKDQNRIIFPHRALEVNLISNAFFYGEKSMENKKRVWLYTSQRGDANELGIAKSKAAANGKVVSRVMRKLVCSL